MNTDNERYQQDKLWHACSARTSQSTNDPSERADTMVQRPCVTQRAEAVPCFTWAPYRRLKRTDLFRNNQASADPGWAQVHHRWGNRTGIQTELRSWAERAPKTREEWRLEAKCWVLEANFSLEVWPRLWLGLWWRCLWVADMSRCQSLNAKD